MRKMVLVFPSKESMAEFIIHNKPVSIKSDPVDFTITGELADHLLRIALNNYGASICEAPDFILPE